MAVAVVARYAAGRRRPGRTFWLTGLVLALLAVALDPTNAGLAQPGRVAALT